MALKDNLVAYYKLDESSGNAADSVGSATLTNTNVNFSAGKINNAADFTNDLLSGSCSVVNNDDPFSVSLWVKTTDNTNRTLVKFGTTYSDFEVAFGVGGTSSANFYGGSGSAVNSNSINDGNWHFIVATYDGTNTILYVDASAGSPSSNYSSNRVATKVNLGNGYYAGFAGSIDEVGIWSRAISSDEVAELYNDGDGVQYPFITTNIKTVNDLAIASVKTVNGLAISSVKSFNDLE